VRSIQINDDGIVNLRRAQLIRFTGTLFKFKTRIYYYVLNSGGTLSIGLRLALFRCFRISAKLPYCINSDQLAVGI